MLFKLTSNLTICFLFFFRLFNEGWREFSKTSRPSICDLRFEEILTKIRPEKILNERGAAGLITSTANSTVSGSADGNGKCPCRRSRESRVEPECKGNRWNRCLTYLIARSPSISSRVSSAAAERFSRAAAICPREQIIAFVLSQTDLWELICNQRVSSPFRITWNAQCNCVSEKPSSKLREPAPESATVVSTLSSIGQNNEKVGVFLRRTSMVGSRWSSFFAEVSIWYQWCWIANASWSRPKMCCLWWKSMKTMVTISWEIFNGSWNWASFGWSEDSETGLGTMFKCNDVLPSNETRSSRHWTSGREKAGEISDRESRLPCRH